MPRSLTMLFARLHDRLRLLLAGAMLWIATLPATAAAQILRAEEGAADVDGRLRGYIERGVILDHSGPALTYFLLVLLAAIAAGVLFKSSRRTHLD